MSLIIIIIIIISTIILIPITIIKPIIIIITIINIVKLQQTSGEDKHPSGSGGKIGPLNFSLVLHLSARPSEEKASSSVVNTFKSRELVQPGWNE